MNENLTASVADYVVIVLDQRLDREERKHLTRTIINPSLQKHGQLLVLIDCPGGEVEEALHLYDAIRAVPLRSTGIVLGECCSSAMLVLQACATRVAFRHARFMCHTLSFRHIARVSDTSLEEFRSDLADRISVSTEFQRLVSLRLPNKSVMALFQDLGDREGTFSAEQAIEAGFLDEIIEDLSSFIQSKEAA
jgi:ATP-dependent protease ClpP protease subunit